MCFDVNIFAESCLALVSGYTFPLIVEVLHITCMIKLYLCIDAGDGVTVPHFVFLAHIVDVSACMHVPFFLRSVSSLPYATRLFLLPCWPVAFIILLAMWVWSKTFLVTFYYLRGRLHQTWSVPRCGFQVGIIYILHSSIRKLPSFSVSFFPHHMNVEKE